MKPLFMLFGIFFILSCMKEDRILEEPIDGSLSGELTQAATQYGESDLNFLLRAVHPSQEVDIRFGDGRRGARFHAVMQLWTNGRVKGQAALKRGVRGWDLKAKSAIQRCENSQLVVEILVDATETSETGDKEHKDWIVILTSSASSTDNPECLIWDIKDSDGSAVAEIVPDGKILIRNSRCR